MSDEYIQRTEHDICVRNGNRNGHARRISSRRGDEARGIFAVNTIDRRDSKIRRTDNERRLPETVTNLECSLERGHSAVIGAGLLILAVIAMIMGATFLPIIGYVAGIVIGIAGIGFIFGKTRPECGFLFKKDRGK